MMDFDWAEKLVERGLVGQKRLNGFYHDNFFVENAGTKYLLRVKREAVSQLDTRQMEESTVLRLLEKQDFPAPRLLYENKEKGFSIHNFIEGDVFSSLYPGAVAPALIENCAELLARLHDLDWPETVKTTVVAQQGYQDTAGFAQWLIADEKRIFDALWAQDPAVYDDYDFPHDPLAVLRPMAAQIKSEPLTLCHGDLHRHNIIVCNNKGLVALDWELALWGDELYDLATHCVRMFYSEDETQRALLRYIALRGYRSQLAEIKRDFCFYVSFEIIKKMIGDVFRYRHETRGQSASLKATNPLDVTLPGTIERARQIWAGS